MKKAVTEPPVLVPVMTNRVPLRSAVGVPVIVPVEVENARPVGKLGLIPHEMTTPEPVMVGESGISLLAVLLIMFTTFGE